MKEGAGKARIISAVTGMNEKPDSGSSAIRRVANRTLLIRRIMIPPSLRSG